MKSYFVGVKGAVLSFVDGVTGEVSREVPIAAGHYPLSHFARFRRGVEQVVVSGGVWLETHGNGHRIRHPGHYDSAANPSFRVSPAQRQAKNLAQMMQRSEALNRSAQKALQAARRANKAVPKIEHQKQLPEVKSGEGEVSAN